MLSVNNYLHFSNKFRIFVNIWIEETEKRYKTLTNMIKEYAVNQFQDGVEKVSLKGSLYRWDVSRTTTNKIDKDRLKADGLLSQYTVPEIGYRLTTASIKEGK